MASEAGRELDALVGTHVFEWAHDPGYSFPWSESEDANVGFLLPQFSTDIAAAWQVVEHLKAEWMFNLIGPSAKKQWAASFMNSKNATVFAIIAADTAPLAICLAALKAVGYEASDPDTEAP